MAKTRAKVITVRLSIEEHKVFRQTAKRLSLPVSGMIRFLVRANNENAKTNNRRV